MALTAIATRQAKRESSALQQRLDEADQVPASLLSQLAQVHTELSGARQELARLQERLDEADRELRQEREAGKVGERRRQQVGGWPWVMGS